MKTSGATNSRIILEALKEFGLLLETDAKLPSVSGLVVGEPVRGSWWTHGRSHEIFTVLQEVVDHKDVLITKLVSGKVTLVHRRLWPEVVSIGLSRERWQTTRLSVGTKMLLDQIDLSGFLRTNELEWPRKFKASKPGDAVRELEKRPLIHSEEFHTDSGAHAKLIESWEHWNKRVGFKGDQVSVEKAKRKLDEMITALNERFGTSAVLPWPRTK
jgi:hypothetical protein